jgi:DcuC family C4-dicarboxylate transporter
MIIYIGLFIAIIFIALVVRLLLKDFFPQAVLLIAGIGMLLVAGFLKKGIPSAEVSSGHIVLDIFEYIKESFSKTNAGVGLMIMTIGGFVAYMDKIGASEALVRVALKPLAFLKKHPNLASIAVIPIGQLIFICIPSAAGFGLLLMASVFPILVNLGVSRIAAVSIITGCTSFCIGPASVITASAVQIAQIETVPYFINLQIPIAIILNLVLMVTYFFVNKYYDEKDKLHPIEVKAKPKPTEVAPTIYALLPVLPLILLLTFSGVFTILPIKLTIETTTAMLLSLFAGLMFELIRTKNLKAVFASFKVFLDGMGDIFKSVVTLIIVAEIFANGLIALGFMDGLITISQGAGLGAKGIGILMTLMIFFAAILMGSGNAAFFAFGPLIPSVAKQFGVSSTSILLPMNLSASMGRAISPIAGVLIATAEVAGVPVMQVVKRNLIPVIAVLLTLLIYHFGLCF